MVYVLKGGWRLVIKRRNRDFRFIVLGTNNTKLICILQGTEIVAFEISSQRYRITFFLSTALVLGVTGSLLAGSIANWKYFNRKFLNRKLLTKEPPTPE